jgi:hypothetical protein
MAAALAGNRRWHISACLPAGALYDEYCDPETARGKLYGHKSIKTDGISMEIKS